MLFYLLFSSLVAATVIAVIYLNVQAYKADAARKAAQAVMTPLELAAAKIKEAEEEDNLKTHYIIW